MTAEQCAERQAARESAREGLIETLRFCACVAELNTDPYAALRAIEQKAKAALDKIRNT